MELARRQAAVEEVNAQLNLVASRASAPPRQSNGSACSVPSAFYLTIASALADVTCDPIVISAGTYSEQLVINRNLTIRGVNRDAVQITGASLFRPVEITFATPARQVTIEHLTIMNGRASNGGGIYNNGGLLTLNDCLITGNQTTSLVLGQGGGLLNSNTGVVTINGCLFTSNQAGISGGAIANTAVHGGLLSAVNITNTRLDNNSARTLGGAIHNDIGLVVITNCDIDQNNVESSLLNYGGAINNNLGGMQISGTRINSNHVASLTLAAAGGAINNVGSLLDNTAGVMTLTNVDIRQNEATGLALAHAGGINNTSGGSITIAGCNIKGNVSASGGGISSDLNGAITIDNSTIADNQISDLVKANGAGIFNAGTLTITRSTINNNSGAAASGPYASVKGGGVFNDSGGTLSLENCTISGNTATGTFGSGGAIYQEATQGAIVSGTTSSTTIRNCTFALNRAQIGQTFYVTGDSLATSRIDLANTILYAAGGANCFTQLVGATGGINSTGAGYNIVNDSTCSLTASGMWIMNGPIITAGALVGSPGGYVVVAVGDYNGDGKHDILLRDSLGAVGIWQMNGSIITSGALVGLPGANYEEH